MVDGFVVEAFFKVTLLALQAMVPIALAAIGEVFAERAGVFNIGLEGIMLLSAFAASVGAELFGSPWAGLALGLAAGALVGLLHGGVTIYLGGEQTISGVGINVIALGIVSFGIPAVWRVYGAHTLAPSAFLPAISTPVGRLSYFILLTPLAAALTHWMLHKTLFGTRVKACGEEPAAADVAGINVGGLRLVAVVYGAALAGLAGAYLSLDWTHLITNNLPAGRGWIAIATVVFSKLNPWLAVLGGLVFGFFDTLGIWVSTVPALSGLVPFQFVRMLPYLVTLLVVAGIGRARFPKALGKPYKRE